MLSALFVPTVASAVRTAQSVCVYNDAAFVLHWHLHDKDHSKDSAETKSYPVWQTKCMSALSAGSQVTAGTAMVPAVKAFWGKSSTPDEQVLYDAANATQVTYICRGTTLDYSCKQGTPPPIAADVVKDVGEFLLGFTEGLGAEIGFAKCLADVNATYRDIVAVVDFFESGVNHKTLPAIVKAFELIGKMLKDFGSAITDCAAEAKDLAAKIKDLGAALSGNALAIIKVVIKDAVHIFHERAEITDDCKSTATHWRAGDYKGAGAAVGDIVGVILGGLEEAALQQPPVEATAGACSAADQTAINAKGGGTADGSFPKITSDCSHSALSIFSGIDETKFNTCLTGKVTGVSQGCSDCYWQASEYGYKNCKVACLASWCSSSCLACAAKFDASGCAGFTAPAPTPC